MFTEKLSLFLSSFKYLTHFISKTIKKEKISFFVKSKLVFDNLNEQEISLPNKKIKENILL